MRLILIFLLVGQTAHASGFRCRFGPNFSAKNDKDELSNPAWLIHPPTGNEMVEVFDLVGHIFELDMSYSDAPRWDASTRGPSSLQPQTGVVSNLLPKLDWAKKKGSAKLLAVFKKHVAGFARLEPDELLKSDLAQTGLEPWDGAGRMLIRQLSRDRFSFSIPLSGPVVVRNSQTFTYELKREGKIKTILAITPLATRYRFSGRSCFLYPAPEKWATPAKKSFRLYE